MNSVVKGNKFEGQVFAAIHDELHRERLGLRINRSSEIRMATSSIRGVGSLKQRLPVTYPPNLSINNPYALKIVPFFRGNY